MLMAVMVLVCPGGGGVESEADDGRMRCAVFRPCFAGCLPRAVLARHVVPGRREMLALCSVTALLGLVGRSPPPRMGGFQQRPGSTAPLGQARVGLLVRGSATAVERLQDVCCGQASSDAPGIRGVIYRLADDSAEVVAEGEREALVQLASSVADLGATLRQKQGLCRRTALMHPPSGYWLRLVKRPGSPRYALARTGASRELAAGHATFLLTADRRRGARGVAAAARADGLRRRG